MDALLQLNHAPLNPLRPAKRDSGEPPPSLLSYDGTSGAGPERTSLNRTPGSARGLAGNGESYLNAQKKKQMA